MYYYYCLRILDEEEGKIEGFATDLKYSVVKIQFLFIWAWKEVSHKR